MNTNQNQSGSIERPAFQAETIADLRELLGQVKRRVDHLPGSGAEAQTLLFQLDAIRELFTRLQGAGADLRAEATRLESIESALRSQDAVLLRELKDAGGLATLRAAANPTREQWWWFLDEGLAQRQKGQKGRILKTVGLVVAVLLIAGLLYRFVLQPEATTTTVMERTSQARDALAEGDLAGATLAYRQAVEVQPDSPELHAWIGVLEEMQGNAEAAAEAYADAERLAGSPARFYVLRGTARSEAGALDLAIADAQAALAIEPDSAEAHLLLGGVYETQGETAKALQSLQQAAELADASGNAALTAAIRVRLGMLSQKAPELPTLSATASP